MKKVKIGVFGLRRGMVFADMLFDHPDAELCAVCDFYEPALINIRNKAKEKNVKVAVFESFEDFISCDMDAVILANYATEHAPYAIRCLERGLHVLSECITTHTMAEAVSLVEAVEKSDKIYQFAENVCFFKNVLEMTRRYRRGDIGTILHCEGEYIHPGIRDVNYAGVFNYGDKNHWRFHLPSTYYCSHSIGPLLYITGLRPMSVTGFEVAPTEQARQFGKRNGQAATMIMELSNGAVMKILQGAHRKKPYPLSFQLYGTDGCMETDRWKENFLHIYTDYEWEGKSGYCSYECIYPSESNVPETVKGHGGSDYIILTVFLQSILGNDEAKKQAVDIYQALDMCIPGILGYRSILNGNTPVKIPDFRNKEEREAFRNDTVCTDKNIAGYNTIPICSKGDFKVSDELYEYLHRVWKENGEETPYFSND